MENDCIVPLEKVKSRSEFFAVGAGAKLDRDGANETANLLKERRNVSADAHEKPMK